MIGQIHDSIILDVNPDELKEVHQTVLDVTTVQLPKAWDWIVVPLTWTVGKIFEELSLFI